MAAIKRLMDMYTGPPRLARGNGRASMKVGVEAAKEMFFDRKPILDALDRAEQRFMSRFGSFVRSDANRSMRKVRSGRASSPGRPPNAHIGYLKKFNFFYYDKRQHDVVIGPIRLPGTRYAVPGLMEYGGSVRPRNSYRMSTYPPRPFMHPALEKNLSRVNEIRGSVK